MSGHEPGSQTSYLSSAPSAVLHWAIEHLQEYHALLHTRIARLFPSWCSIGDSYGNIFQEFSVFLWI